MVERKRNDEQVATQRNAPDAVLVGSIAVLVAIGLVMIFSASSALAIAQHHDAAFFLKRQIVWLVVGIIAAFAAYRIEYEHLRRFAPFALVASVLSLGLVLIPHIGLDSGGARRWLGAGAFSLQPSEFAKLALVLYLAAALSSKGERVRSLVNGVVPLALVTALLAMLVLKEPDMGTASLLTFTAGAMLFAAGARIVHLLMVLMVTAPWVVLLVMHDAYKRARILAFLNPWKDTQDKGFQIVQSLLALGSGGPFGVGLGFSRQKFGWLPETYTDFIGSILGEELGFIGMFVVVMLFVIFAYRAARIALNAPDRFGYFLALGCMAMIVIQAFVNIGVVTSSWPVTGVPLPFISFGGSSLVVSLVAVALVVNVGRHRRRSTG
jgi:cell division protein FtsW